MPTAVSGGNEASIGDMVQSSPRDPQGEIIWSILPTHLPHDWIWIQIVDDWLVIYIK